ncbi:hypothetical protein MTR67_039210, partial [Solanum verrucosum]
YNVAHVEYEKKELIRDVHRLALLDIKSKKHLDPILIELKKLVLNKSVEVFSQGGEGVLRYKGRLCAPNFDDLREKILDEAHDSRHSILLGMSRMYRDLWEVYWWNGMKKDIACFVAKCPNCQQVKVEHKKSRDLSQDIEIPTWKWEDVNMDFVVGLPHTRRQHDSICVIVDRMTKICPLYSDPDFIFGGRLCQVVH